MNLKDNLVRKFFGIFFLILIVGNGFAQSGSQEIYYAGLIEKARALTNQGRYADSRKIVSQVLQVFPDHLGANVLQGFNLINLNNTTEAKVHVNVGFLVDPTFYPLHYEMAYLHVVDGNLDKAKESLTLTVQYGPEQINMPLIKSEFETVGKNLGKPEVFLSLYSWHEQNFPSQKQQSNTLDKSWKKLSTLSGNAADVKQEVASLSVEYAKAGRYDLVLAVHYLGSSVLRTSGFLSEALELAEIGFSNYKKNGFGGNDYQAARLLAHLMEMNNNKLDFDNTLSYWPDAQQHINMGKSSGISIPTYAVQVQVLAANATANSVKGTLEETQRKARELALQSYELAKRGNYGFGMALSANVIVITHDDAKNAATGVLYGEQGLQLARELNLDIKESIASNLAFCYYGLGTPESKQLAYNLYRHQAEKELKASQWEAAATDINSLGTLLMYSEDWERAASLFEEVVKLEGYGPKYTNYHDRLTFYKRQVTAYQNLIKCYAHIGNAEKAFQAMEASRSRVLLERLGQTNHKPVSLADLQNLLKPDEACIMYSVTAGHEIIMLTVSKKYAQVIFHEDPRFIGDIKEKVWKNEPVVAPVRRDEASLNKFVISTLRNQTNVARDNYDKVAMAPKSDLDKAYNNVSTWMTNSKIFKEPVVVAKLQDFLYRFQKYLIVPVTNRLVGIKSLIIAPDDIFNFIPFEALRAFDGKYMVEKYNFRYIHSASVLMALEQRNYLPSRKPLLAMGGAIYEQFDQEPMGMGSSSEMNLLESEVAENVKTGNSLRRAYASVIGTGPLPPLLGTAEEIKNISKNLPGAEIFIGKDMTENRLKEFSKSGQLKNYKVLHLATHGMVVPEVPDLSCLAMCIFKNEEGGEDGFLSAPEIAGLQLNTDLTVLSACETGKGKFFAGEGVTGITQSLILAGSNAALVTLWKVDDAATMNFMSSLYKEVAKGKPYPQIVNELKRKFIKGEYGKEFQHPYFWAPFIYYGK